MDLAQQVADAQRVLGTLGQHRTTLEAAATGVIAALKKGKKLLVCGNGGSAAEAQHFVTELVGRYDTNRVSLPAVYLGGDASMITCIANDFSFDDIFSRPLQGLSAPGDVLVCFTTSGNSPNVLRALEAARSLKLESLALLGKGGGKAKGLATWEIIIDSKSTARVQEAHLLLLHWLCEQIEPVFK